MLRKQKGFTLLEMLIVVAIIGILIAIAAPALSSSLSKSKETVCTANRTSLYREILYEGMMDDSLYKDDNLRGRFSPDVIKSKGYVCPAGGEITAAGEPVSHSAVVSCSIHGQLQLSYDFGLTVSTYMNGKLETVILDLFKKFGRNTPLEQVDSTAPAGGNYSGKIIAALSELTNHSLGQGVTASWALCNIEKENDKKIKNSYQVYWSGGDISKCNAGDQILMMYYDATSSEYALKLMSVKESSDSTVGGGKKYNKIDITKGETLATSQSFADIHNAYVSTSKEYGDSQIKPHS